MDYDLTVNFRPSWLCCAIVAGCQPSAPTVESRPTDPTVQTPASSTDTETDTWQSTPAVLEQSAEVVCANPAAREDAPFDTHYFMLEPAPILWVQGGALAVGNLNESPDLEIFVPTSTGSWVLGFPEGDPLVIPLTWPLSIPSGVSMVDVDQDGDQDVFVTRFGLEDRLLRNDGVGFTDITEEAGLVDGGLHSFSSSWADIDMDGDLDLAIGGHGEIQDDTFVLQIDQPGDTTRLYENKGDGTFTNISDRLPQRARDAYTFIPTFVDLDGDDLVDLFLANDFPQYEPAFPVLNRGTDTWEIAEDIGLVVSLATMGVGVGDIDGDDTEDFLLPAWGSHSLRMGTAFSVWAEGSAIYDVQPVQPQVIGWGAELEDLDNDGQIDAAIAYGHLLTEASITPAGTTLSNPVWQPDEVLRLVPDGPTERLGASTGTDHSGSSRTLVTADLNRDGWLDIVKRDIYGTVIAHLARCGTERWIRVRLHQEAPNRDAVGAIVRVISPDGNQRRTLRAGGTGLGTSRPAEAHFGLGQQTQVTLSVTWPDGTLEVFDDVDTNRQIDVHRGSL